MKTFQIPKLHSLALIIAVLVMSGCAKDKHPPVASFSVSPESGNIQTSFLFDGTKSSDEEDPTSVLQVRWDWENDGIWDTDWSSSKTINHKFEGAGTFHVSMEVKDTDGSADATTKVVKVLNTPVANFTVNLQIGTPPLVVKFNDQSSNNPTSWSWDFGDGTTSDLQNPGHIYYETGLYDVSLKVSNEYGSDSSIKENFIIVDNGYSNGIPCPGIPTVSWKGFTYNTVLIGTQCWLKENLRWDTGINWCYDYDPLNCQIYGRLYNWKTMMNGGSPSNTVPSGVQGICPDGWHLPSDVEWAILEGTVDSQYGVNNIIWGWDYWRGYDAGNNLKSASGWYDGGNGSDKFGFQVLPGGYKSSAEGFKKIGIEAYYTMSNRYGRRFMSTEDRVYRNLSSVADSSGFYLRCLKD